MKLDAVPDRFLLARCGEEYVVVEHRRVRRIVSQADIAPVPVPLEGFLGLSRFGGEPIAIFSLGELSGIDNGESERPRTVLVVEFEEDGRKRRIGLAVSEVVEFFDEEELEAWRTRGPKGLDVNVRFFDIRTLERPEESLVDSAGERKR